MKQRNCVMYNKLFQFSFFCSPSSLSKETHSGKFSPPQSDVVINKLWRKNKKHLEGQN